MYFHINVYLKYHKYKFVKIINKISNRFFNFVISNKLLTFV